MLLMACYHFGFDLNMNGLLHQDLNHDPKWLAARTLILSTFLFISGASLVQAAQAGFPRYWQRLAWLAGAAALVSIGSTLMFPASWIFFGVLHFILVAGLIGRLLAGHERLNLGLGIALIALGLFYANPLFDRPLLQWLGLMTFKPITEDYVPLIPWFGVVLLGMFVGRRRAWLGHAEQRLSAVPDGVVRPLAWSGRHSLVIYLVHQPILLGLLWLFLQLK